MIFPQAWGPCVMWTLTSLFYSFQFFLRSSTNAMSGEFMKTFGINMQEIGILASAYFIPYSLLQIPVGVALDIWGPKKVLRIGTLLCVIGGFMLSVAGTFYMAVLSRVLIGIGAAVSFIGSIRMNAVWFTVTYLGFATGLLSATGKLAGSAAANAFIPSLLQWTSSWQMVLWGISIWGAVLCILIWIFGKNGPEDHFESSLKNLSFFHIGTQIVRVLKIPVIWYMGIYGYALYLTLSVFSDTYSIDFLTLCMNIDRVAAGKISCFVAIGSACGAAVISYLSDRFRNRVFFLRVSAFSTLILSTYVVFGPTLSPTLMSYILFFWGFMSGGQILVFIVAGESVPKGLSGMGTGVVNAILMAGGAIHNPLIGSLLRSTTTPSLHHYHVAFSTIIICFVIACVLSFLVKESHPLQQKG